MKIYGFDCKSTELLLHPFTKYFHKLLIFKLNLFWRTYLESEMRTQWRTFSNWLWVGLHSGSKYTTFDNVVLNLLKIYKIITRKTKHYNCVYKDECICLAVHFKPILKNKLYFRVLYLSLFQLEVFDLYCGKYTLLYLKQGMNGSP